MKGFDLEADNDLSSEPFNPSFFIGKQNFKKSDNQDTRISHLRAIAMPRDTNSSGDMFGGWTLSQMDLAGATFAARHSGGRVATVSIDAMKFLRPIKVGDDVSCYCLLEKEGEHSIAVKIETWSASREDAEAEKVTEGIFTYVALDDKGKPRTLAD